jgi:hypothetical protein
MAKLLLKSIAYYPLELTSMPEAHQVLGRIDTDLPYKKLVLRYLPHSRTTVY